MNKYQIDFSVVDTEQVGILFIQIQNLHNRHIILSNLTMRNLYNLNQKKQVTVYILKGMMMVM